MKHLSLLIAICLIGSSSLFAQPELYPWGNLSGIRVDGELMELNTSLALVGAGWSEISSTGKEKAQYSFHREGSTQFTNISIDGLLFDQSVEALGAGGASVRINFRSEMDTALIGAFLMMELPCAKYGDATIQLVDPTPEDIREAVPAGSGEILRGSAKGFRIKGKLRDLSISIHEGTQIIVRKDPSIEDSPIVLFFALKTGHVEE